MDDWEKIVSVAMLETHPLRGAMFENLALLELLKRAANAGHASALSFFRDKTGHEVDFVVESGAELTAIEVKCTSTYRAEYHGRPSLLPRFAWTACRRCLVALCGA